MEHFSSNTDINKRGLRALQLTGGGRREEEEEEEEEDRGASQS